MWRKFQIVSVLFAWLLATGSHWDFVQVFAWGRMIASYAEVMPLTAAVRNTFQAGNRCELCMAVENGKKQSDTPTAPESKFPAKIILIYQPAPAVAIVAPAFPGWTSRATHWSAVDATAPPTPPPRAA